MRFRFFILLLSFFSFSCVMKDPRPELEKNLKDAMQKHLYSLINNDSSNVKYDVESVIYYDDPKLDAFVCDFTVRMKTNLHDTTGVMRATVSKDFKTVKRSS